MRPPYDKDGSGDWFVSDDGDIVIRSVGDEILSDETFLVALHELVEMKLCDKAGVSQKDVDGFDASYRGEGEPGDDENAPYRNEHRKACLFEFLMADMLGMAGYGTVE